MSSSVELPGGAVGRRRFVSCDETFVLSADVFSSLHKRRTYFSCFVRSCMTQHAPLENE